MKNKTTHQPMVTTSWWQC